MVFQRVLSIYKEFLFQFQGFLFPIPGIISLQHTSPHCRSACTAVLHWGAHCEASCICCTGTGGSSATSGYRLRPSRCGACGHGRPACHDRTGTEGWHHCSQHKKPFTSLCLSSKFDTLNMVLIPEVRGTRHAKRVPRTFFLFNLMTVYRSIS